MNKSLHGIFALQLLLAASMGWAAEQHPSAESFTLATAAGQELTLPEDQNGVGVYLFWASWCPYCKALMPHLQSIDDEYQDRLTVYALNFRDQQDPRVHVKENGFDFVVMPDADPVAAKWGVQGTPGLIIVDPEGRIRFNLYDVLTENPPGFEKLGHAERAQRRAPFWAARIREALDEILTENSSTEGVAP